MHEISDQIKLTVYLIFKYETHIFFIPLVPTSYTIMLNLKIFFFFEFSYFANTHKKLSIIMYFILVNDSCPLRFEIFAVICRGSCYILI